MTSDHQEGPMDGPSGFATFIVRVVQDSDGGISSIVEWVRTGQRIRVSGFAAIGEVIACWLTGRGEASTL